MSQPLWTNFNPTLGRVPGHVPLEVSGRKGVCTVGLAAIDTERGDPVQYVSDTPHHTFTTSMLIMLLTLHCTHIPPVKDT